MGGGESIVQTLINWLSRRWYRYMGSDESRLQALVKIGRDSAYEHLAAFFDKNPPGADCFLLKVNWEISKYLEKLTSEDIAWLIKSLVVAENQEFYRSGSTNGVHKAIEELRRREWAGSDEIEDWAFQNAKNHYVPFGTINRHRHDARNVEHYWKLTRAGAQAQRDRELAEQTARQKRKQERAERHVVLQERQRTRSAVRQVEINELEQLSPTERLRAFADGSANPTFYYPENFAVVGDGDLAELDPSTADLLRARLRRAPSGPWRLLRKSLGKTNRRA